jgi:hypothetical protein
MHLHTLPDNQKLFFQKRYFLPSGVVKNVFWCICTCLQTTSNFFQKRYFLTSGVVKNVFWCICAYFQTTRNFFSKNNTFYCMKWLKTCFDAFAHTSRTPETFFQKIYFLPSGVVKNVFWCICAYFQTTRNFFSKKIFFTVWSG